MEAKVPLGQLIDILRALIMSIGKNITREDADRLIEKHVNNLFREAQNISASKSE